MPYKSLIQRASILCLVIALFINCDTNEETQDSKLTLSGAGVYAFDSYAPLADKSINYFYYLPKSSTSNSAIFIVLPGAGRDASALRDDLISKADEKGIIVLALEFSSADFPGSDAYNLANIFHDGDNPSPSTLNPEAEWTFSALDPIFEDFKALSGNTTVSYDVFGHSAGAQMIHRYLIFKPQAKFNRLVSSAAGWYAVPNPTIEFPYGLRNSPAETADPQAYFSKTAYIIVGQNDTDPNSFALRHNEQADQQGINRLQRAQYFFQESFDLASAANYDFKWQYRVVPNLGHDGSAMARFAMDFLY
ncbi:MAG: hypothetical protein DA405_10985 [Bacteroidetes bacterium]|nr:MAG: hypothetical protein DA405_10985 [Bacteroidota bacterium]